MTKNLLFLLLLLTSQLQASNERDISICLKAAAIAAEERASLGV